MTDFKFEAWPTEFRAINRYFGANQQNYAQYSCRFRRASISWRSMAACYSARRRALLRGWHELQNRSTVIGVTFFVASASNPALAQEVWVGRGIGALAGAR